MDYTKRLLWYIYVYSYIIMHLLVIIKIYALRLILQPFSNLIFARVVVFSALLLDLLTLIFWYLLQPACLLSSPHYPSILSAFRKIKDYRRSINFVSATVCRDTMPPHSGTHTDEVDSGIWRSARLESWPGHLLSWLQFFMIFHRAFVFQMGHPCYIVNN